MIRRTSSSVRVRIVAAATITVALVLIVAGFALVALIGSALERPIRGEARAASAAVVAALDAAPTQSVIPALATPFPTLIQVIDAKGAVVAASADLGGRTPLLPVSATRREPSGHTTLTSNSRTQSWRLDAVAATVRSRPATVIVATSLAQIDRSARLIAIALTVAIPVLVLFVALLAWLLVGRALRPVEALRREVNDFDHRHSDRRVTLPTTDDEIGRLAQTLNQLLERLDLAGAQQRRFVADASHELRSPVANIRAALEVARAHPDDATWPEIGAEVLVQNARMGRLVDDLLLLARAESGTLAPRNAVVDLADLVEAARDRAALDRLPIRLGTVQSALVRGDANHLERVIDNLLANAQRHASSLVEISVRCVGHTAQVSVIDDGPGVPPDDRVRIFQRFVRLDADRSRRGGGTGLGLAIVAEVVAAHGGTISVSDAHPGAVFTVRLPLDPHDRGLSASP